MNPENRWIKMADAIPWDKFEKKYSRLFKGKKGRVAKPLRLALGSLMEIIISMLFTIRREG